MMKIGNVKLENNLILAPMAGVNCTAFRILCKEYGAGLVYTQMFHADSIPILEDEDKLKGMIGIDDRERPVTVQIVGKNIENIAESTKIINKYADIIDFNLGCPDKDILGARSGGFFSKHPEQISKALMPLIQNSKKPVTAKIRLGWNSSSITVIEQCKILQDLGVDAIAVHGRTVKQGYTGKSSWEHIKKAKERSNVLIIGNGDISSPGNAKAMLEYSKVDAIMVGRGCMGDPAIFSRIRCFLDGGENKAESSIEEKLKAFLRFAGLYNQNKGQFKLPEFKAHAMWFVKGIKKAREIRNKIMRTHDFEEIIGIVTTHS